MTVTDLIDKLGQWPWDAEVYRATVIFTDAGLLHIPPTDEMRTTMEDR